jgi:hypothetical protein
LAGVNLAVTAREKPSDLFALAVHIHLLLMAGNHPFLRGTWTGGGEQPDAMTLARAGQWAGGPGSPLRTHPLAPPVDFLPDGIQRLFVRAFTDGARDPSRRPSAAEWRAALQGLQVRTCVRGHQLPVETQHCPWCRIDDERVTRKTQRAQTAQTQTIYKVAAPPGSPPTTPTIAATPWPTPPSGNGAKTAVTIVAAIAVLIAIIGIVAALTSNNNNTTTTTNSSPYTTPTTTEIITTHRANYNTPPPDAVPCGDAGGRYTHAARGSDLTSCPFAMNVLTAVNQSSMSFPAILQVYSPVTHQNYGMSCAVEQVLTCRGGNNAIVYVY